MLVLTRKPAETIHIGENIVIKVIKTARGAVKIGIEAPADVRIARGELIADSRPEVPTATVSCLYHGIMSDQFPHVA